MRNWILIILCFSILTACEDKLNIDIDETQTAYKPVSEKGMQRAVFSSREELKNIIAQAENISVTPNSRSLVLPLNYSNNEDEFISLLEANRREVMASLTQAQLDSINNDEDELEFEPTDSVICDVTFALLLNANRELQVADTIYKFYDNGVLAFKPSLEKNLDLIEEDIKDIHVTPENEGVTRTLSTGAQFTPFNYIEYRRSTVGSEDLAIGVGGGLNSGNNDNSGINAPTPDGGPNKGTFTDAGIKLSNGYTIPLANIRDFDFDEGGNGNWFQSWMPGLTHGFNITACNTFRKRRKMTLNFYHYNYIVYSSIGVKIKMQKKVCGIWWNIKTDEMLLGWETVCIREEDGLEKPDLFPTKYDIPPKTEIYGKKNLTEGGKEILFHVPFINYDFTNRDVKKTFDKALKIATNSATNYLKAIINEPNSPKRRGLFTTKDRNIYTLLSPSCIAGYDKRSIDHHFISKTFPCDFTIGICYNGDSFKPILSVSLKDHLDVYYGQVFAAVKFEGRWLGARITKVQKNK